MHAHEVALAAAGALGVIAATFHGVVIQRALVPPLELAVRSELRSSARRVIPLLLHFSTFNWLVSGLSMIGAAFLPDECTRFAIAALAGSPFRAGGAAGFLKPGG